MTKTEPRSAGSGGGRDKNTPTELLACPFCGGQVSVTVERIMPDDENHLEDAHSIYLILCCHIALSADTEDEAIAAWNTRAANTLSAREDGWQPIETVPRDATVLVVTEATAANTTYGDGGHRNVYPAYIDEDGAVCDGGNSGHPDPGIKAGFWRAVLWQPLPPPPKAPTAGEGHESQA